jgi:rod shape-determining protein MreD
VIETLKLFGALFFSVFVQLLLTRYAESFYFLDLPLVAVIYFATYKGKIASSFIGSTVGLVQDSVSGLPLGINGFTKTLAGYMVAAISGRLILESYSTQFFLILLVSMADSLLKFLLFHIAEQPLSARFIPLSLLQAVFTATLGSGLLLGVRSLERWYLKNKKS